jgi:hypothetical protein
LKREDIETAGRRRRRRRRRAQLQGVRWVADSGVGVARPDV